MGFPVNSDVRAAEAQTKGTSSFQPASAPTTDHFRGHPDWWTLRMKTHQEDDFFWASGTLVPSFLL